MKNFPTLSDRLTFILADRRPYTWAKAIGIHNKIISRALNENISPGPRFLNLIAYAENVSINWLLTGQGAPFVVDIVSSDEEGLEEVDMRLNDEPDLLVYLLESGRGYALVLATQMIRGPKEDPVLRYMELTVFAGALGPLTAERAMRHQQILRGPISGEDYDALRAGQIGTYKLMGYTPGYESPPTGLLAAARPVMDRVAEPPPAPYSRLTQDEQEILSLWRQLNPDQKDTLLAMLKAML